MMFPVREDLPLLGALQRIEKSQVSAERIESLPKKGDLSILFSRAEHHSLCGVLVDSVGPRHLPASLARALEIRAVARELDHRAHIELLRRIDQAFASCERPIVAVALKGPLLAERFYRAPSSRGSTDVDLMIEIERLDDARLRLESIGYQIKEPSRVAEALKNHHDILFVHPELLDVELHFRAYRGFGETLRSEPLIARSESVAGYHAIRVLSVADELVYLSVHAAAHRFGRLSWLYDIHLLLGSMSKSDIALAAQRAREVGFANPVALASQFVADAFGADETVVEPLRVLSKLRTRALRAVVAEPANSLARSSTRLVYSAMLCDSLPQAARYLQSATTGYARARLGR